MNNFPLSPLKIMSWLTCATNSSYPNTGFEIFVPGRGLLSEQYSAFAETPISFERSSRVFFFHWFGIRANQLRPVEIGVTNRICTGTNAFTKRDAALTP